MKKKLKKQRISIYLTIILLTLVAFIFFPVPVSASENTAEDFFDRFLEIAPENIIGDGSTEEIISGVGFDAMLSEILSAVNSSGTAALSFFSLCTGLALSFAFVEGLGTLSADASRYMRSAVAAVGAYLMFSGLAPLISSVRDSISGLSSFFSALVPIASGIIAAGGAVGTASVQALNMNLALAVIEKIGEELLLPLCITSFALSLVCSVDGEICSPLIKGVRSVFNWAMGIVTTVLVSSLSLQSVLSGAKDSAVLRAAKYAASGSIPIVGSTVSGALTTLFGSISYIGTGIGVGSIFIIASMVISPLLILLSYRAAISLSRSVLDFFGTHSANGIFSSFLSALDSLIAVYVSCALIYLLELIIFLRCGVKIFA